MTLLEALVALVVLGLTASGFLQAFREGGRTAQHAAEWSAAVAAAEATMEGALLDAASVGGASPAVDAVTRFRPRVAVRPWPGAAQGVDEVTATVTLSGGRTFTLHRLVRRASSLPPSRGTP